MSRIFIAIPSFQEEDLQNTVDSIFLNASDPSRIFVGICNQRTDGRMFETFQRYGDHVRSVNVSSPYPLGLGFAYYSASRLLSDEEFVLRIDAHTRMKPNWDETLIAHYELIASSENTKNIIISQLTGGFLKNNPNKEDFLKSDKEDIWLHEKEPPNTNEWVNELVRQFKKHVLGSNHQFADNYSWTEIDFKKGYKEVPVISGSFHFSINKFWFDCSPDPRIHFWGEEQILALRAWTRGYKIFSLNTNTQFTCGKPDDYLKTIGGSDWRNSQAIFSNTTAISILSGCEIGYYGAKNIDLYTEFINKLGLEGFQNSVSQ